MAAKHYGDLNKTVEYLIEKNQKPERQYDWSQLDVELKLKGHHVRRLRNGAIAFLFAGIAYAFWAFQFIESGWGIVDYIMTVTICLVISWLSWRLAARSALRLANEVSVFVEDNAITDVNDPGLIFAPWIPKATKGLFHRIQMIFRRIRGKGVQ